MDVIRKNKIYTILGSSLQSVTVLCASGTLMQTLLAVLGFSEQWIYIHATLVQTVNVLTILLGARFADKGNVLHRSALIQLPAAAMFLFYLPLCIGRAATPRMFVFLLLVTLVHTIAIGLYSVCMYKLPYFLCPASDYGYVQAFCGVASSLVSLGFGSMMRSLSARYPYVDLMAAAFVISFVFLLLAGLVHWKMKPIIDMEAVQDGFAPVKQKKVPLKEILRQPVFSRMIIPNVFRGISNGTVTIFAVVAFSRGFDETVTTSLVSVQAVAGLLGSVVFGLLSRKVSSRWSAFLGSAMFAALPLLLVPNAAVFLSVCALVQFGKIIADNAVPMVLRYAVPVDVAGPYNAWRLALHYGGTLLGTSLGTFVPVPALLLISVACQLTAGVAYCWGKTIRNSAP